MNPTPDDELLGALTERGPSPFSEIEVPTGALQAVAFHISDGHGVVLGVRKRKDDSFQWESLRYLGGGSDWEVVGRTWNEVSPPIRPPADVDRPNHVRILQDGGWVELEETGVIAEGWREVAGFVSEAVSGLYIRRDEGNRMEPIKIFDSGAFAFIGPERLPLSDSFLVAKTSSETHELQLVSLEDSTPPGMGGVDWETYTG